MNRLQQAQKLGKMLRDLIHDRGWSVLEAARRSQIHPSSMRDYVNGITFPTKENRELLAPLLGISLEEFNALFELADVAPARPVDELCREVRLLSREDFTILTEVVFSRIMAERRGSSSPP
jgi:transcriptional regulator with XRE-family HTH domain